MKSTNGGVTFWGETEGVKRKIGPADKTSGFNSHSAHLGDQLLHLRMITGCAEVGQTLNEIYAHAGIWMLPQHSLVLAWHWLGTRALEHSAKLVSFL